MLSKSAFHKLATEARNAVTHGRRMFEYARFYKTRPDGTPVPNVARLEWLNDAEQDLLTAHGVIAQLEEQIELLRAELS